MEQKQVSEEAVEATIRLGELALAFGCVDRATCHPDGVTHESDTDHTVMLGLIACAFAERFVPTLDRGKIAQFALVHDLVEVYAGDTATGKILSSTDLASKEAREHAALVRIKEEFDPVYPWIGETILAYERLDTPEARYVKTLDKAVPKITNILNNGAPWKRQGHTHESGSAFLVHQRAKLEGSYASDQPEVMALLTALGERMLTDIFADELHSRVASA